MSIGFVHPSALYALWAIPPLAAAIAWRHERRQRAAAAFIAARMRRRLGVPEHAGRPLAEAAMGCAAIALAIVALARPQWGEATDRYAAPGRDVLVLLDVSRSMLAADLPPSRLARAKADVLDLLADLRGERVAVLAFRRGATLLCPFTTDYGFVEEAVNGASPDSAPPGETDIAAALEAGLAAFGPGSDTDRLMLLISDGEQLSGSPDAILPKIAASHVRVFTFGVGTVPGAAVPDPYDPRLPLQIGGTNIVSRLESATLRHIAAATGALYGAPDDASLASPRALFEAHTRAITAKTRQEQLRRFGADRFQMFLLPSVLLALGALRLSASPSRPPRALRLPLILSLALGATAARAEAPALAPAFNAALDLYHSNRYEEAEAALLPAAEANADPRAWRLIGAARWRQAESIEGGDRAALVRRLARLRATAEALRVALRLEPDDPACADRIVLAMREEARVERALQLATLRDTHAGDEPDALVQSLLLAQRHAGRQAAAAASQTGPERVPALERAAAMEAACADLAWVLTSRVATNAASPAEAERAMRSAAALLRDLSPSAARVTAEATRVTEQAWLSLAAPGDLVDEALVTQTNASLAIAAPSPAAHTNAVAALAWGQRAVSAFMDRASAAGFAADPARRDQALGLARAATNGQAVALARLREGDAATALAASGDADQSLRRLRRLLTAAPASSAQAPATPPPPPPHPPPPHGYTPEAAPTDPGPQPPSAADADWSPQPLDGANLQLLINRAVERGRQYEARKSGARVRLSPNERDW